MNYKQSAQEIFESVGGNDNIKNLVHCATRLRFELYDNDKVDLEKLEKSVGVKGTVKQGAQFQVIIGSDVKNVYDELQPLITPTINDKKPSTDNDSGNLVSKLITTLTEIFAPALPAITGAGMFKALLAAVQAFNLLDTSGQTYQILYAMSDAVFYFLPMIIGYTASVRFGGKPTLVLALAGLLVYPNFVTLLSGGEAVSFFGIPVATFNYGSSVIPIILIAYFESYIEKYAYQYVPVSIRYFIAPLIVLFVCGAAGILVLGPIGGWLGDIVSIGLQWLIDNARIAGFVVIGVLGPITGMTGIHQSFTPITIAMFTEYGFDPLMFPAVLACNMAQCGVALAVGIREKDVEKRSMILSTSFTALMGITEPALFGVTIKSKKNFAATMIGGGLGALIAGLLSLKAFAISGPGLASLPMFLGGDNPVANIVSAVVVMVSTIVITFVITLVLNTKKA